MTIVYCFLRSNISSSIFEVAIGSLEELLPGNHPGLDVICDGILTGSPFIYPAEELGVHDR